MPLHMAIYKKKRGAKLRKLNPKFGKFTLKNANKYEGRVYLTRKY